MESSIFGKLAKAICLCENPKRNTKGYNYKYADLAQVASIVKPACEEVGIIYFHSRDIIDGTEVEYLHILDLETGEEKIVDKRLCLKSSDHQAKGSDETYSRRYSLLAVFGLSPEDDDGAAAKPKEPDARHVLMNACESHAIRHSMPTKNSTDLATSMLPENYGDEDMLRVAKEMEQM